MFYGNFHSKCIVGESNMNKYALTLPLVTLSVLLSYFGSNLEMEHVYAFLAFTAAGVTTAGCFLSNKQQVGGDRKRVRK
jgi:hypothetical protein